MTCCRCIRKPADFYLPGDVILPLCGACVWVQQQHRPVEFKPMPVRK